MKITTLLVALAAFSGAASAGDLADPRADGSDYVASLSYRLDFGGASGGVNHAVALNGVDLRGPLGSSGLTYTPGDGFFSRLTFGQWVIIGVGTLAFAAVASDAIDDGGGDGGLVGTGGSGD